MQKSKILIDGVRKLEELEKSIKSHRKTPFKKETKKLANHDDLRDYDDMNIKIYKNKYNISSNVALINTFPNVLLLENSINNCNNNNNKKEENKENKEKKEQPQNIWDTLNKLTMENDS